MKHCLSILLAVLMILAIVPMSGVANTDWGDVFSVKAAALTDDVLEYEVWDDEEGECRVIITGCDESASGELEIPSEIDGYPVTRIGMWAFDDCSGLTSITIPDSVTSIGYSAFGSCSNLTSITIPDSVTSIGNYAFINCSGLAGITVDENNSVYNSRENCNAIIETSTDTLILGCKNTIIPEGVKIIGENAFYGCLGLTSITIPDSVTSIGDHAFRFCSGLAGITVDENNSVYDSREDCNAIIETSIDTLILGCKNTIIPEGVKIIDEYAFGWCTGLTSITIPDSVTSIGDYAFFDCTGLTSITIPDSVTSIGESAFYFCFGLTSITIPDSVTSIGDSAFYFCFGLTSITIPDSVTSIGSNAFYDCSSLTSINVDEGNSVYDSRENCNAIIESSSNTLIVGCQTTVIPNDIVTIGEYAFKYCYELTGITIPDSVTSIGASAFEDCSCLASISIPDSVTSIGNRAFKGCSKLTVITIPDSVTSIGNSAFEGCSRLTSVTIPYSVTSIGDSAFKGCQRLLNIEISDGVINIGENAFQNCHQLTNVVIPESVTSVGGGAFSYCKNIKNLTITSGLENIGNRAFYSCRNLKNVYCYCNKNGFENVIIGSDNGTVSDVSNWIKVHTPVESSIVVIDSCASEGTKTCTCSVCGETVTEKIPRIDHTDENNDYICDICGNNVSDILSGETKNITVDEGKTVYLEFVPKISGSYIFTSISDYDTYGYLYDENKEEIVSNDDGGTDNNFEITYDLTAGARYIFWEHDIIQLQTVAHLM